MMNAMGMLAPVAPQPGLLGNQPLPTLVNPATNDAPLEFNKAKAGLALQGESDDRRARRSGQPPLTIAPTAAQQQSPVWAPGGMMGMSYPPTIMGMMPMTDPAGMMGMGQSLPQPLPQAGEGDECGPQWGMPQYPVMGGMIPPASEGGVLPGGVVKEIIHCKSCTLFPPNPNVPPPTTREIPPGCRTVFVGGLPENVTEEIIREVFERCGEITTIRVSKKNFCHIRFEREQYVDRAIYLSGYRIRIGNHTDPPNTGRLHVDYAQARDDLYEWECRQRQLQREARHRERLEQERMRPPSPPPVVHYTEHESQVIADKLKGEESFAKAVQVVVTWLERGDCCKRNSNQFYSMIQSSNSHVRRLLTEKMQYEDELNRAKELTKQRMQGLLMQFGQIERVFAAASHQKVWDHFTKAQRKNISMWKKQAGEIRSMQLEEAVNERADEEMDVSDSEDDDDDQDDIVVLSSTMSSRKKPRLDEVACLKEENDNLKCQLEAYKNEVDLIRADLKCDNEQRDAQYKLLQQTLQNTQQQLLDATRKLTDKEKIIKDLEMKSPLNFELKSSGDSVKGDSSIGQLSPEVDSETASSSGHDPKLPSISSSDAKLIGLISMFLHVHPFGAGIDYIWSYLQKVEPNLRTSEVEALMNRFPSVFKQELSGIGANMERKWIFAGFCRSD
ncbi:ecto-NOX disulfide-thiol exchanger 2 isoform X2 [Neocloeon triangulifer]|nr:ecto-NOX disulfide-thiol exchanger 2 isoform X2 [Neocloeon triangulifer]